MLSIPMREIHLAAAIVPAALLAVFSAADASAQAGSATMEGGRIVVVGDASLEIDPDYAEVVVGVEVHDSTAAAAATQMDRRMRAVVTALEALGFPGDSLPTSNYAVTPDRNYRVPDRPVTGYGARTTVTLTIRDLSRVGTVVGVALDAGANTIGEVRFRSSREDAARERALAMAVAEARRDASALAAAAGVELGDIQQISTANDPRIRLRGVSLDAMEDLSVPEMRPSARIVADAITVRARVTIAWGVR
jgi:uncharacterized protein YggE